MSKGCRVCGNKKNNTLHVLREMMFGYRDEFEYIECFKCGCLQISEIPINLEKYYPDKYYSLPIHTQPIFSKVGIFLKQKRFVYCLKNRGIIGNIATKIYGVPDIINVLKKASPNLDSEILDVGCGAGHLLLGLRECGFLHLTGIDPFISDDICYKNGVRIYKINIYELTGKYDFIILNHSFEHMSDPVSIFQSLSLRVATNGLIIIRTPLASSFAWRYYKTNWVQLDAPRHLFLHSIYSIEILAEIAGLRVESIEFDSNAFQFWGSEQYQRDIPLYHEKSFLKNRRRSIFSRSNILEFKKYSAELNADNNGDQATIYIRKISSNALRTNSNSGRC
jgi:SAM-dependent methyltransferase